MDQGKVMPIDDLPADWAKSLEEEIGVDETRNFAELMSRMAAEHFLQGAFRDRLRFPLSRISKQVARIERIADRVGR